jgi:hypothetical protein
MKIEGRIVSLHVADWCAEEHVHYAVPEALFKEISQYTGNRYMPGSRHIYSEPYSALLLKVKQLGTRIEPEVTLAVPPRIWKDGEHVAAYAEFC